MSFTQYTISGEAFVPVGPTVQKMPPGFYNITSTHFGIGAAPASPISDDLIDIAGTPADNVLSDIATFLSLKELFEAAGLTHKLGYLIYGPQGTGKTSVAIMAARRFIRDHGAVVFHIPHSNHLRYAIDLLNKVDPGRPSMYLMEEAEMFLNDANAMSILDGELSIRGAIFMAMTNHKERLPPRIANRPGRFDRVIYMGAPPLQVQREYLSRLVARLPTAASVAGSVDPLVTGLSEIPLSMGHLREAFISHMLMGVPVETIAQRFREMQKVAEETATLESLQVTGQESDTEELEGTE